MVGKINVTKSAVKRDVCCCSSIMGFGPPSGPLTSTAFGAKRRAVDHKTTRKWTGMQADAAFGAPGLKASRASTAPGQLGHVLYAAQDGGYHCSCCNGAHQESKSRAKKDAQKPDFSGRKMAKGDEWRYRDMPPKVENGTMRSNMVSSEAPEFITRVGVPVPMPDFGHAHPFADPNDFGRATARLRDASVQKGCGRRCAWRRAEESADSPFGNLTAAGAAAGAPQFARRFGSGGPEAGGGGGWRGGRTPRPSSAPAVNPPYAVSGVQHSNDFNQSSTRHQLGKQVTSRFYNSIGGWGASR